MTEQRDRRADRGAEQQGKQRASHQNTAASPVTACRLILAGESRGCLRKCRDHVIGDVLEIHGSRCSGCGRRTKFIDSRLYKDVGKTENSALQCRWNADFKNGEDIFTVQMNASNGKAEIFIRV